MITEFGGRSRDVCGGELANQIMLLQECPPLSDNALKAEVGLSAAPTDKGLGVNRKPVREPV